MLNVKELLVNFELKPNYQTYYNCVQSLDTGRWNADAHLGHCLYCGEMVVSINQHSLLCIFNGLITFMGLLGEVKTHQSMYIYECHIFFLLNNPPKLLAGLLM